MHACITFDQPLWLKAVEVIKAKSMMSFMGRIGSMMKGSGIEEALETVYGPNVVTHMISGMAVSRALRGQFLVCGSISEQVNAGSFTIMQSE